MLTELRTFVAVVRYGSFARAGAQIGLTQGAVSGQIQRLERDIGVTLFDRSGRKAVLTTAGRDVHARAEDILAAVGQLGVPSPLDDMQGTLVIGAITSVQQSWLLEALSLFRRDFPGVTVRVTPGASLHILGQVDTGEVDVAVMVRPPYVLPSEVRWHSLVHEPFVVLVPAGYPGNDWREALTALPFIRYDRTSFGGRVVNLFLRKQQIMVHDALEFDDVASLARAVEQGMGVAIMPAAPGLVPFSPKVRVLRMDDIALFREIGIADRSQRQHPEITNRLVGLMQTCAARDFSQVLQQLQAYGYPIGAYVGHAAAMIESDER